MAGDRVAELHGAQPKPGAHGERSDMPGVLQRLKQFAQSPQGRRTIEQARRTAADPRRRAQAQRLFDKLRTRRSASGM